MIEQLTPRRKRSDRIVIDVRERFRAGSGICWELMNRGEPNSGMMQYDRFGSVAVMSIKVPDGNAFNAGFQCIERSDGDVAEITETHRSITCGVMPGRPHEAKRGFATQCCARRLNRSAGPLSRVHFDVRIKRRIEIEITPRIGDAFDMLMRMRAQQFIIRRGTRLLPFPLGVPVL